MTVFDTRKTIILLFTRVIMKDFIEIIKELESKHRDAIAFQKKYKTRNMLELLKYYEGAEWALSYAINLLKDTTKTET